MNFTTTKAKQFVKKMTFALDHYCKTDLFEKVTKLARYYSSFKNVLRRKINYALITLRYKIGLNEKSLIKLHLGCGNRHFQGYSNIDLNKTKATDFVFDIRKLPYTDNSVENEWWR